MSQQNLLEQSLSVIHRDAGAVLVSTLSSKEFSNVSRTQTTLGHSDVGGDDGHCQFVVLHVLILAGHDRSKSKLGTDEVSHL